MNTYYPEYSSQFPTQYASFGAPVKDNVDVVQGSHVNSLRAEVLAIETFLGRDLLLRSGAQTWSPSSPPVGSSFTSLRGRLEWLEDGLARHNHDDRYPLLSGGSTILSSTTHALAFRNHADATLPAVRVLTSTGDETVTLNGANGVITGQGLRLQAQSPYTAQTVVAVSNQGSGHLLDFTGISGAKAVVKSDAGLYLGTSESTWFRSASPNLQVTTAALNDVAVQAVLPTYGTAFRAVSGNAETAITSDAKLRLTSSAGRLIVLEPAASSVTIINEATKQQQLVFSSYAGVPTSALTASGTSTNPHSGDLAVDAGRFLVNATAIFPGGVSAPRYRTTYTGDREAWVRRGSGIWRSEEWNRVYQYLGGSADPEKESLYSSRFIEDQFEMRFVAPPSGEATMLMTAEMYGMNSTVGLGWTLTRADGQAHPVFNVPAYARGLWFRSEGPDGKKSSGPKNYQSVSNNFMLYWLTPGHEYVLRFWGTWRSDDLEHHWARIRHIRVQVTPVLGA